MIEITANNITSPLGWSTEDNYLAAASGKSGLDRYDALWDVREPFVASLFSAEQWDAIMLDDRFTRFESLLVRSIAAALASADVDPSSPKVLLIVSSAKGNIELLDPDMPSPSCRSRSEALLLGNAALAVASYFRMSNVPIVISNACVSGLSAQIAACRAICSGRYNIVIVAGAEVQSRFIVTGFQSLKALSSQTCKPFDIDRSGLNLGEAAATMIIRRTLGDENADGWTIGAYATCNDAYHISSPSHSAEGYYKALVSVMKDVRALDVAMINLHGTSTLYNDEMEARALHRAGLADIPVNSLKGYYGHTMGAAGILESILSMRGIDAHTIFGTKGYSECGVGYAINISEKNRPTDKKMMIKTLSGFGGTNVAIRYQKGGHV